MGMAVLCCFWVNCHDLYVNVNLRLFSCQRVVQQSVELVLCGSGWSHRICRDAEGNMWERIHSRSGVSAAEDAGCAGFSRMNSLSQDVYGLERTPDSTKGSLGSPSRFLSCSFLLSGGLLLFLATLPFTAFFERSPSGIKSKRIFLSADTASSIDPTSSGAT